MIAQVWLTQPLSPGQVELRLRTAAEALFVGPHYRWLYGGFDDWFVSEYPEPMPPPCPRSELATLTMEELHVLRTLWDENPDDEEQAALVREDRNEAANRSRAQHNRELSDAQVVLMREYARDIRLDQRQLWFLTLVERSGLCVPCLRNAIQGKTFTYLPSAMPEWNAGHAVMPPRSITFEQLDNLLEEYKDFPIGVNKTGRYYVLAERHGIAFETVRVYLKRAQKRKDERDTNPLAIHEPMLTRFFELEQH